jgi:hypothetical protein
LLLLMIEKFHLIAFVSFLFSVGPLSLRAFHSMYVGHKRSTSRPASHAYLGKSLARYRWGSTVNHAESHHS